MGATYSSNHTYLRLKRETLMSTGEWNWGGRHMRKGLWGGGGSNGRDLKLQQMLTITSLQFSSSWVSGKKKGDKGSAALPESLIPKSNCTSRMFPCAFCSCSFQFCPADVQITHIHARVRMHTQVHGLSSGDETDTDKFHPVNSGTSFYWECVVIVNLSVRTMRINWIKTAKDCLQTSSFTGILLVFKSFFLSFEH